MKPGAIQIKDRFFVTAAFINLLTTVGVSILVASIFTFASSSYDFVEKIKELLEDIIVRRNFLRNIDPESKKEALKSLIQPSASESNKYPNIRDYYEHFINKTLAIGHKQVRSGYSINARAYIDEAEGRIAVEGTYNYRVYPSADGFADIEMGYQKENNASASLEQVRIWAPNGSYKVIKKNEISASEDETNGDHTCKAKIPIDEIGRGQDKLDVELKIIEYGSDKWILFPFRALQPTDGFTFQLHCDDGLKIQHHYVFLADANYYLDLNDGHSDITITCHQWINEGSGLTVLIFLPQVHDVV